MGSQLRRRSGTSAQAREKLARFGVRPISHKYGKIVFVRTTVDIPDSLYRQLKAKAAEEGRSVKKLILRGVEAELQGRARRRAHIVSSPLVRSERPGTLVLDNAKIFEIIPFP